MIACPEVRRMNKLTRHTVLILVGLFAVFSSGCGTKSAPPPEAADATKLPGAAEVSAALEKKDYDGAMAGLLKLKQTIATEEQHVQFMLLSRTLSTKLSEAAPTDPKAAEALANLRVITTGR